MNVIAIKQIETSGAKPLAAATFRSALAENHILEA